MPKRLIALMQLQEQHLGKLFFPEPIRQSILSWDQARVNTIVGEILHGINYGHLESYRLCPNCVHFCGDCRGCNWVNRDIDSCRKLNFDNIDYGKLIKCLTGEHCDV